MNLKEIKELIDFISSKNIAELEIDKAGLKLRIKTTHSTNVTPLPAQVSTELDLQKVVEIQKQAADKPAEESIKTVENKEESDDIHVVCSPIVGTFYRAPSPESKPFVEIGSQVVPGTVLCIVEAMKLMNEIESDVAGEVVKIHQENGKPVEFGQPLFSIKRKR